ncbi:hypothetical protein IAT40_004167 [Kwoniella sp. CBS 6097]
MDISALEKLVSTSTRMQKICGPPKIRKPLQTSGLLPDLRIPDDAIVLPNDPLIQQDPLLVDAVLRHARSAINAQRRATIAAFKSTTANFLSVSHYDSDLDRQTEKLLCAIYQDRFAGQMKRIQETVIAALEQYISSCGASSSKKSPSFSSHTLVVLDAAYARTKSLTQAETNIIAKAAGISPHQVRTWFQNKRNRGKDKKAARANAASASTNRPVSSLPKRAQQQQQVKLESQANLLAPAPRRVRALPKRAAQASHNAPNSHIVDSSLGTYQPSYASSEGSQDYGLLDLRGGMEEDGNRMTRAASFASTSSNSTEVPNGGFISPYEMHLPSSSGDRHVSTSSSASGSGNGVGNGEGMTQIAIEWGTGMLNIPIEALGGGQAPVFNFTPPSPLNVGFDPTFNPANYAPSSSNDSFTLPHSPGQVVDIPLEMGNDGSHFPFSFPDNLDLTEGLESIESILTEALSDPKSFEHFSTLAASPQISLDSLSPRSDSSESLPSLPSGNVTPGQEYDGAYDFQAINGSLYGGGSLDEMEGDFFNALEGLLASPGSSFSPSGAVELGSPIALEKKWNSAATTPEFIRSMSMMSDLSFNMDNSTDGMVDLEEDAGGNAIIDASQGIDLSYIASIPLPASPTSSTFSLPRDYSPSPSLAPAHIVYEKTSSSMSAPSQQDMSMSTTSDTSSIMAAPFSSEKAMSQQNQSQGQWEWIGALPFEMEMMEVDVIEGGSPDSVGKGWEGGMSGFGGMIVQ